jgi:hypothetical protein
MLYTRYGDEIFIDTSGNIGLGRNNFVPLYSLDVSGSVFASNQLISGVTAQSPLIVSSSQKVVNLNVDYLNGLNSSYYLNASNLNDGVVGVSYGGIGTSTLSSTRLLVGNGTNPVLSPTALTWNSDQLDVSGNIRTNDINIIGNIYKNGQLYEAASQWSTNNDQIYYSSGNVGIGTSNPSRTLDVSGDMIVNNFTVRDSWFIAEDTYSVRNQLQLQPILRLFYLSTPQSTFDVSLNGYYDILPNNVGLYLNGTKLLYYDDNNKEYDISVNHIDISHTAITINVDTQTQAGDILDVTIYPTFPNTVGTRYPGYVYQVFNQIFNNASGIGTAYTLANVGIGTNQPLQQLDVSGNASVSGTLYAGNVDFSGNLYQNGSLYISSQWTSLGSKLYYNNGYVGIGTNDPQEMLDVSGNIKIRGDILPADNVAYDLGSSSNRFRDIYLSGSTIDISGALIKLDASNNGLRFVDSANNPIVTSMKDVVTSGNVTVGGDLTINGTFTTVNTDTVTVKDPIITLGGYQTLTFNDNKDRGVEFRYFDGSSKIGFFGYDNATGNLIYMLDASNNGEVFSGTYGNIRANAFIGESFSVTSSGFVSNLNADLLDGQHGSYYNDWTNLTNKPNLVNTFNGRVGDVSLNATDISTALTYVPLNATTYTASDILNKLITVDGSGSQLDADYLDGYDGTFYRNATNINSGVLSVTYGGIGVNNLSTNKLLIGNATNGILSPNELTWANGQLDISGNLKANDIDFYGNLYKNGSLYISSQWTDGSNNKLYYNLGNVGINTSNPTQTLDVSGTMIVNNFIVRDEWFIANDTPFTRTKLQIQPITKTFLISSNIQSVFDISMNGRFVLSSPKDVHVFVDGVKLGYIDASNNDYTVSTNTSTTYTQFTITLIAHVNTNNVVDIVVYPRFLTEDATKEPGYVYQVINSPWDVSGGVVYYNDGNVGIGSLNPSTKLDVSGNALINGTLYAENIDFSANLYQNGSLYISSQWTSSGSKLYYSDGHVGIGTNDPQEALDVSGNIKIKGNILPADNVAYDLGSSSTRFRDLYLSGSTIDISGALIKLDASNNGIRFVDSANNPIITSMKDVVTSGNVTIGGDLTVNGTFTTVNTDTVTVKDPIITLGGYQTLTINDNKDRGVEFRYFNGSSKIGFFGYDNNTGNLVYLLDASNNNEVFSGTYGNIRANAFIGESFSVTSSGFVSNLNADLLDGQHGSYYNDWTNLTNKPNLVNTFNGRVGDVSLNATDISTALTYVPLNAATYTASDVLTKLITVDGSGSQLDADYLDGYDGSYYRNVNNVNSGTLSVTYGGTGNNALNTGKLLMGAGTNPVVSLSNLGWDASNNRLDVSGNIAVNGDISVNNISFSGNLYQNGVLFVGGGAGQWSDGSDNTIYYNDGNVGIGTTNPTQTLDISGDMIVNNFTVRNQWFIAQDTAYTRTQLQIKPINKTFVIDTNGRTNFDISMNGRYQLDNPQSIHVYVDGVKLGYYDVSKNDYTVSVNLQSTYTQFYIYLNRAVNIGNVVEIFVYPKFLTDDATKEPGYVYQAINSPWDISNNHTYYYTGNVGIGTTWPLANLDVSGSFMLRGNFIDASENVKLYSIVSHQSHTPMLTASILSPDYTTSVSSFRYVKNGFKVDAEFVLEYNLTYQGSGTYYINLPYNLGNQVTSTLIGSGVYTVNGYNYMVSYYVDNNNNLMYAKMTDDVVSSSHPHINAVGTVVRFAGSIKYETPNVSLAIPESRFPVVLDASGNMYINNKLRYLSSLTLNWVSYIPSIIATSNPNFGGTISSKYVQLGKTTMYQGIIDPSSNGFDGGSGVYYFRLPFLATVMSSRDTIIGTATIKDSDTGMTFTMNCVVYAYDPNYFYMVGTGVSNGKFSDTYPKNPITSSVTVSWYITYETAIAPYDVHVDQSQFLYLDNSNNLVLTKDVYDVNGNLKLLSTDVPRQDHTPFIKGSIADPTVLTAPGGLFNMRYMRMYNTVMADFTLQYEVAMAGSGNYQFTLPLTPNTVNVDSPLIGTGMLTITTPMVYRYTVNYMIDVSGHVVTMLPDTTMYFTDSHPYALQPGHIVKLQGMISYETTQTNIILPTGTNYALSMDVSGNILLNNQKKYLSGYNFNWMTYTPSISATSSLTLGTGASVVGRYTQIGKSVTYQGNVVFGTGFNPGTGSYYISLPIPFYQFTNNDTAIGTAYVVDSDTNTTYSMTCNVQGSNNQRFYITGGSVNQGVLGANFPRTPLTNSIRFSWFIMYEGATSPYEVPVASPTSEIIYTDGYGNLGIGTNILDKKLVVNGDVTFGKGLLNGSSTSAGGGTFHKQQSWDNPGTTHTITYPAYCIGGNSAGTLMIQVSNKNTTTPKVGNAVISFIKSANDNVDLFITSTHTNPTLITLTITASGNNVIVTTDSDCRIAWTSIGAF